jgi:transcriptional regulator with XRE-family HTH domain
MFFCYEMRMPVKKSPEEVVCNVVRLIRKERERQGISMNVLSERAGLSQAMISLVERDLRNPTLDTLLRIANALDLDLGKVISKATLAAGRKRKSDVLK